ncbi:MAG: hypothetical protein VB858_01735 [Planctomycetaceae bacterium]
MPFCSRMLVVFGLLYLKQAQQRGMSMWTAMIAVSWSCAVVFPVLGVTFGGTMHPELLWQPAIMGGLFLVGQLFTFLAVEKGDVSIAAPVLGIKVLILPATAPLFVNETASPGIWLAATIAVVGIGFVQARDESVAREKILVSVGFALLAAVSMTIFDLLIQRWARDWGAGYFLPAGFACAAVMSLGFLKRGDRLSELRARNALRPLVIGSILMALQAIGMTLTIGRYGDATRVNIVYSLRGLWGVLLTWLLTRKMIESESPTGHRTMAMRLVGAVLIGVSVVISVSE